MSTKDKCVRPKQVRGDGSLAALVRDYQKDKRPGRMATIKRFRGMPSLSEAVRQAALARNADDKCEAHQRRVGVRRLTPFEKRLQARLSALRAAKTFDDLHELIAACRMYRVGALAIYDTAVRIGAFLGLEPTVVYLHAGARTGARALGLPVRTGRLEVAMLPSALHVLSPDEIEDFLCIYKEHLALGSLPRRGAMPEGCAPPRRRRGVC